MNVELKHNPARHRYGSWRMARQAGFATYRREGDDVLFLHTAVDPAYLWVSFPSSRRPRARLRSPRLKNGSPHPFPQRGGAGMLD